jgi:putative two-component system response regulator
LNDDRQGNPSPHEAHLWTGPPRRVLVVDDDQLIVRAVARMLRSVGLVVEGTSVPDEALAIVARDPPHVVVSDLHMPLGSGVTLLAAVAVSAPSAIRVLMSADPDFEPPAGSLADARVHALMSKADLRKLSGVLVEQLRGRAEAPEANDERERLAARVARACARPGHENDAHRDRVTRWTTAVAATMGLSAVEIAQARLGAILHDVGQVTVRDRILARSGPLSREEREHVATHTEAGARIVAEMPALRDALPVIRGHHEPLAASGAPPAATPTPRSVRAFQVADSFDAMISGRPYAVARSYREALEALGAGRGAQHDRDAVAALEALGEDGLVAALAR